MRPGEEILDDGVVDRARFLEQVQDLVAEESLDRLLRGDLRHGRECPVEAEGAPGDQKAGVRMPVEQAAVRLEARDPARSKILSERRGSGSCMNARAGTRRNAQGKI